MAPKVPDANTRGQAEIEIASLYPPDSPLSAYMDWACAEHGSPPIYHLCTAFTLFAHELARRGYTLQRYPISLWYVLLGDSGTGKSTAIRMGQRFIRDLWRHIAWDPERDPWLELEGSIAGLLTACQDYYESWRGTTTAICYHHELAAVFASREAMSEMLCRLIDGDTFHRNLRELQRSKKRANQGIDKIIEPRMCGLFATTEAQLAPYFKEAQRVGGIFSRFLWIKPEFNKDNLAMPQDFNGSLQSDAQYQNMLDVWCGWHANMSLIEHDKTVSKTVTLSREAHAMLEARLFKPLQEQYVAGDELLAVKMRLVEKTRVLAALFATMRCSVVIESEDMEYALRNAELLAIHAQAVNSLGAGEVYRLAMKIEVTIRDSGNAGVARRDLYQRLRVDKRMLDLAIDTLLDKHAIVLDPGMHQAARYLHRDSARGALIATQTSTITQLQHN